MFLLWLRQLPWCRDQTPASVPLPAEGRSSPTHTPVPTCPAPPPQFLHPTEFCVVLYILFHWSGTPVCSQLVFCTHFCVWRCIPDVSVERDVLHVHLLLCHPVLSNYTSVHFSLFVLWPISLSGVKTLLILWPQKYIQQEPSRNSPKWWWGLFSLLKR